MNAKEYQDNHTGEINDFNKYINKKRFLLKAINRFLFNGVHDYNNRVDAIIYGEINKFVCVTYAEVVNYLLNVNEEFNSIHFSLLTLQPWARNLNYNEKHEYRSEYVQVKWYRMEEIINKIIEYNK